MESIFSPQNKKRRKTTLGVWTKIFPNDTVWKFLPAPLYFFTGCDPIRLFMFHIREQTLVLLSHWQSNLWCGVKMLFHQLCDLYKHTLNDKLKKTNWLINSAWCPQLHIRRTLIFFKALALTWQLGELHKHSLTSWSCDGGGVCVLFPWCSHGCPPSPPWCQRCSPLSCHRSWVARWPSSLCCEEGWKKKENVLSFPSCGLRLMFLRDSFGCFFQVYTVNAAIIQTARKIQHAWLALFPLLYWFICFIPLHFSQPEIQEVSHLPFRLSCQLKCSYLHASAALTFWKMMFSILCLADAGMGDARSVGYLKFSLNLSLINHQALNCFAINVKWKGHLSQKQLNLELTQQG